MSDIIKFAFAPGRFSRHITAISIASSWAWGVSIVVGMNVFSAKGIGAFLIWASANALALAVFGWASRSHDDFESVVPRWTHKPYHVVMMLIQWFCLLVNITAIQLGTSMIGLSPIVSWLVIATIFVLWIIWKGYVATVWTDIYPALIWMGTLAMSMWFVQDSQVINLVTSQNTDYKWALWGAVILFAGPFMDRQMWQRRKSVGESKPFYIAALYFAVYMLLVGCAAVFLSDHKQIIGAVILLIASSTLSSSLSAISSFFASVRKARMWMVVFLGMALVATLPSYSILAIWTAYGSMRIPFAIYLTWKLKKTMPRHRCISKPGG